MLFTSELIQRNYILCSSKRNNKYGESCTANLKWRSPMQISHVFCRKSAIIPLEVEGSRLLTFLGKTPRALSHLNLITRLLFLVSLLIFLIKPSLIRYFIIPFCMNNLKSSWHYVLAFFLLKCCQGFLLFHET